MHEGGWEPFVHHFSPMLGGVVPQDEETRANGWRGTTPARRELLLCPAGLGAKGTEEQGLAGFRAPILRRPRGKKPAGLGAKGTEEQGVAGFSAPSPCRPRAKKPAEFGAKGTEKQGMAVFRAPILRRPWGKKPAGLGAKGTEEQGLAGFRAPSPYRPQAKSRRRLWKKKPAPAAEGLFPPAPAEVYKLPYDNKSVLKGNFFCGIILSPERGQRCDTGNNMKGDAI